MTTVRHTMDAISAPKKEDINRLDAIKDEDINLEDISELNEHFWEKAKVGEFYRPIKKQITIKIDADVLAWLKSKGKGYQTRLNAILREEMTENVKNQ